jgi:flagellar biosynthesis GTPase FlhF
MDEITTEIKNVNSKIYAIEQLLKKPFRTWSDEEKEEFENHEYLRKKEEQLRKEKDKLLILDKEILLKRAQSQGFAMDIDSEGGQIYNPKPQQIDAMDIVKMKDMVAQITVHSISSMSESNLNVQQNSFMSFQVPVVNERPNILYSNHFYNCLNEVRITPFPQRIGTSRLYERATMLIGTSGSGKTATCYEIDLSIQSILIAFQMAISYGS